MKKLVFASVALMLTFAPALAHTTRDHHSMTKGKTNSSLHKGSMSMGNTGMGHGRMQKGIMRPDASGQGGSGPGSDQGGTRVSRGAMK
jgi:hypothetical protein